MSKIEIKNVTKTFGSTVALDQVNLCLEENKIYGLLGRNGAGKSTLLNIISNRIFADKGEVQMDGEGLAENDEKLGKLYLMSEQTLYPETMSIKEVFKYSKLFYPEFDLDYAMKLADMFKLDVKKKVKALSTGYSSIFKLITAMSVNTPFVFLDEPVLGLDANHRELFYKIMLEKYSEQPFTIVISTHLIEEVSSVIEEVIIIKEGKVLHNETREEILGKGYTVSGPAAAVEAYVRDKKVIGMDGIGGLRSAYVFGVPDRRNLPAGLEIDKMDLQKLFVQLTN